MCGRVPRQRGVGVYDKPPLSHAALVTRMQDRGLIIPDVGRAERYVRSIGYYRLSPYMIPFRCAESDNFRSGVAFDDVLDLYVFAVSYTHLTLPTTRLVCRSRWSPYH